MSDIENRHKIKPMTKDEFIDGYVERSNISAYRTDYGFFLPGSQPTYAKVCHCEEEGCLGWAMIPKDGLEWHRIQESSRSAIKDEEV